MAICNLVLDMGNVLLGWQPQAFARRVAGNEADAQALHQALFATPDWAAHDAGQITEEELLIRAQIRLPQRQHAQLSHLIANWPDWMPPIPGAEEVTLRAQQAGLSLYLLSNAGARFPDALRAQPFYPRFSGMLVSYHERLAKPDPRIYLRLCERFSLQPVECFFVDDIKANVQAAEGVGLHAHHFTGDWQPVIEKLHQLGVSI